MEDRAIPGRRSGMPDSAVIRMPATAALTATQGRVLCTQRARRYGGSRWGAVGISGNHRRTHVRPQGPSQNWHRVGAKLVHFATRPVPGHPPGHEQNQNQAVPTTSGRQAHDARGHHPLSGVAISPQPFVLHQAVPTPSGRQAHDARGNHAQRGVAGTPHAFSQTFLQTGKQHPSSHLSSRDARMRPASPMTATGERTHTGDAPQRRMRRRKLNEAGNKTNPNRSMPDDRP